MSRLDLRAVIIWFCCTNTYNPNDGKQNIKLEKSNPYEKLLLKVLYSGRK